MSQIVLAVLLVGLLTTLCDINTTSECCQRLDDPERLTACVVPHLNENEKSDVAIAIWASRDIWDYAAYSLLVNNHYIKLRGYKLRFYGSEDSTDFFPQDRKWNKIGSVLDSLDPATGWARKAKYFVAMDADLIVSALDIIAVGDSRPEAHLILSRDAADFANTGFMIVRNTKWSYQFFQTWWDGRYLFSCDQHAFNDLYSKLQHSSKSRQKIAILPHQSLNSEYPVYSTFDPRRSSVLHLFGEKDCIRQRVFQRAASALCADSATARSWFGLTREFLARVAAECFFAEISSLRTEIITRRRNISLAVQTPSDSSDDMQQLPLSDDDVHSLRDLFDRLDAETSGVCGVGRGITVSLPEQKPRCVEIYTENAQLAAEVFGYIGQRGLELDLRSRSLYSAHILMEESFDAIEAGMEVVTLQDELFQFVPPAYHDTLSYRQAMTLYALAFMSDNLKLHDRALEMVINATRRLETIHSAPGQPDYETHLQGRLQCFTYLCSQHRETQGAFRSCARAVDVAEELYSARGSVDPDAAQTLIETLVQSLQSVAEAGHIASTTSGVVSISLSVRVARIRQVAMMEGISIEGQLRSILDFYSNYHGNK